MSLAIRALFEPVRTLGYAAVVAAYVGVGTVLNYPARIIYIQNTTDTALMFSFDGVNDHFPLLANAFLLLDLSSNKSVESGYFIAKGDRLYAKYITAAPTSGSVYFTTVYGIDY
jgi:hypothetical protein